MTRTARITATVIITTTSLPAARAARLETHAALTGAPRLFDHGPGLEASTPML